jgi:DDE superfamily endonuclease
LEYFVGKGSSILKRALRMDFESFEKLVYILSDTLKRDMKQGDRRGGAIKPIMCVFATIRWLAGGSYLDIAALLGVSVQCFYSIVSRTIQAIIESKHPDLDNIKFPKTKEECAITAADFKEITYHEAINNCVSAIDGYLLSIITPSASEVGNVRSYFSDYYQAYGCNVQAACDSHIRISFIGLAGPGVMPDRDALKECELHDLIEKLPLGYVAIGDAAYTATEKLASIYYSDAGKITKYDSYNYLPVSVE